MLLLSGTSHVLQLITGGTQSVTVHTSWVDANGSTITPSDANVATINTATTTTILTGPAAGQRNVKLLTIRNGDASTADAITLQHTDGTNTAIFVKCSLNAGNTLVYEDGAGFYQIDPSGNRIGGSYGSATATSYSPTGLTGATAYSRYVGATASGPPTSAPAGGYLQGDWCIAQNGHVWICVAPGTPGTWVSDVNTLVFRPQDYQVGNTYDPTGVSDSSTSFAAMVSAYNTMAATGKTCLIQIPPGIFKMAPSTINLELTSNNSGGIFGAERSSSLLTSTTTAGVNVSFNTFGTSTIDGFTIADLGFYQSTPLVSGFAIDTNGASDVIIQRCLFYGQFDGIGPGANNPSARVTIEDCVFNTVNGSTTAVPILVAATSTNLVVRGCALLSSGTNRSAAGFQATSLASLQMNNCLIQGVQLGLLLNPGASQTVSNCTFTDCVFDSCTTYNIYLNSNATTAVVKGLRFNGGQSSLSTNAGVATVGTGAAKLEDVEFNGFAIINNTTHGIQHGFGTDHRYINCSIRGNSTAGSAISDGINVASGITPILILGCKIGGTDAAPTGGNQRYGVNLVGGAIVASIIGCDLIGNVTASLNNASTGLVQSIGNSGLPTTPAATAPATALVAATNTYFGAMSFPANYAQAGSCYEVEYDLTSSSATSNAVSLSNFWGTLGTTGDQAILGPQAITALVATGVTKVKAGWLFKVIGATTTIYTWMIVTTNGVLPQVFSAQVNTTSKTTSACFAGIGVNSTNATLALSALNWTRRGDRQ